MDGPQEREVGAPGVAKPRGGRQGSLGKAGAEHGPVDGREPRAGGVEPPLQGERLAEQRPGHQAHPSAAGLEEPGQIPRPRLLKEENPGSVEGVASHGETLGTPRSRRGPVRWSRVEW